MTVYDDRTFTFVLKVSPMSRLILKAAGIDKGSGKTPLKRAGTISKAQLREVAETKMPDLNAGSIEAAERMVEGTAKSMGIEVK
jgi:large subunit ribosomal protein L11